MGGILPKAAQSQDKNLDYLPKSDHLIRKAMFSDRLLFCVTLTLMKNIKNIIMQYLEYSKW